MAGPNIGFATLSVIPSAKGFKSNLSSEVGSASDEVGKESGGRFGKAFGAASKVALGGAIAAAGIGIKGLMDFTGFERQMNEVFTLLPGISGDAMDEMTGQVKNFSKEFGVLPDQVVPALYQSLSAGVPPENVFEFLETAQMAAKGGVTELTTAVDGISSVVNAYGSEVIEAAEASDLMFTAVRLGKTNFEELSASLSNVTPISSALGVGFEDVTAGLAAMTAQGTPTAQATTQMRSLFVELSKAGGAAADTFEEMAGKTFQEFIAEGGNTAEALDFMKDAAKESGVQLQDLFSSVEAGGAALSLTGSDAFVNNLDEMAGAAGATEAAFDQMNTGLGPIFDRIKANVAVFLIDVGERLAPIVERVLETAGQLFNVLFKGDFTGGPFSEDSKLIDIAFRIRDVVGEIMGIAKQAFDVLFRGDFTGGPFEEDSAFIGALFTVRDVVGNVAQGLKDLVEQALTGLSNWWSTNGETVLNGFGTLASGLKSIAEEALSAISNWWSTNGETVLSGFESLGNFIWDPVITAFGELLRIIKEDVFPELKNLYDFITNNKYVLAGLAIFAGVILFAAFTAWAVSAGAAALTTLAAAAAAALAYLPVILIAAAIGLLAAGLWYAYENWGWFQDGVDLAVASTWSAIQGVLVLVGWIQNLVSWLKTAVEWVENLAGKMDDIVSPGGGAISGLFNAATFGIAGNLPSGDDGGVWPGPRGVHSLGWVAGGETLLPTHRDDFELGGGGRGDDIASALDGLVVVMDSGAVAGRVRTVDSYYHRRNGG